MDIEFERSVGIHEKIALKFLKKYFKVTGIETNILELRDLNRITRGVLSTDIKTGEYSKRKVLEDEVITESISSFQSVCTEITFQWLYETCGIDPYSIMHYRREFLCDLIHKIRYESDIPKAI